MLARDDSPLAPALDEPVLVEAEEDGVLAAIARIDLGQREAEVVALHLGRLAIQVDLELAGEMPAAPDAVLELHQRFLEILSVTPEEAVVDVRVVVEHGLEHGVVQPVQRAGITREHILDGLQIRKPPKLLFERSNPRSQSVVVTHGLLLDCGCSTAFSS